MKLLKKSDGEWFPYMDGELRIRPVPAPRAKELHLLILGRTMEMVFSKGQRSMKQDTEKWRQFSCAKAAYALMDSKNAQIDATDDRAAAVLSTALGRTVAVGEEVTLDGHWTEEVKGLVFEEVPTMVDWVNDKSDSFAFKVEEAEGKE